MTRPTWDEYFMSLVDATALRASCDRGKSGAVITRDRLILSTGYVGAPRGLPDCDVAGHDLVQRTEIRKDLLPEAYSIIDLLHRPEINLIPSTHCIRTIHAELNAILNAARHGNSCLDATLYCTMVPCRNCAMAIIQSGIKRVVSKHPYHKGQETFDMFKGVGVDITVLNENELY